MTRWLTPCLLALFLTPPAFSQEETNEALPRLPLPPADGVRKDLVRQKALLTEISELLQLMESVSQTPPEVLAVLMDNTLDNPARLRRALGILNHAQPPPPPAPPDDGEAFSPGIDPTPPSGLGPGPFTLTASHLVFVRLPDAHHDGVAALLIRGRAHALAIGERVVVDEQPYVLEHIYRDGAGRLVVVFDQRGRSIVLEWI